MTTHVNDQILTAVVSAVTGLATTGARVDEWELKVKEVDLPRLVVEVSCSGAETGAQGLQTREIAVVVSGYAKKSTGLMSTLGAIQKEVEVALAGAGTLGGLMASGIRFMSDERGIDYSLEKPVGKVSIVFSGLCFTRNTDPSVIA